MPGAGNHVNGKASGWILKSCKTGIDGLTFVAHRMVKSVAILLSLKHDETSVPSADMLNIIYTQRTYYKILNETINHCIQPDTVNSIFF